MADPSSDEEGSIVVNGKNEKQLVFSLGSEHAIDRIDEESGSNLPNKSSLRGHEEPARPTTKVVTFLRRAISTVDAPKHLERHMMAEKGRSNSFRSMAAHVLKPKQSTVSSGNMALFEDEAVPLVSAYLHAFTMPGPIEKEASEEKSKKANMGVIIGVYLPTIQHIFGVLMFLRLFWIVGSMGVWQSFLMVFLCCLCTFLTSISMSAIATNGVVESGGSYFMISRNLGPQFGSAVGILFYLANTVATAMYLVGGVEIFLMYIAPGATIGGPEVFEDTGPGGQMANNFRLYATGLLLIEFVIVAAGVRFVQIFAPLSLICVVMSILSIYAGAVEKTINPNAGPVICMLGDTLLQNDAFLPPNQIVDDRCFYCTKNNDTLPIWNYFCPNNSCNPLFDKELKCVASMPGFASGVLADNFHPHYMDAGDTVSGVKADKNLQVFQDLSTSFFILLAIYFPSVTGIMTGSNMSGDLKDPQKSIPTGTLAAQFTTSFVYLSFVLVFGGTIHGALLRDKYGHSLGAGMVVAELAWPSKWVMLIGSFTSTFGAALQCLCSAPRLLQSIAKDNVIPLLTPFSVVTSRNEPFRGLVLTAFIAELAILIGAIDYIAPVVDFFFLMCYAFVNLVTAMHSLLGAPNWRPRFKYYHWSLSLLGAVLCFFIMFATHWYYAIISILLCLLIYRYVEWKGAKKEWGDGMRGLALSTAQFALMKVEDKDPHPKNWRPQLLVLMKLDGEDLQSRYENMINLASQFKGGKGLTVVASLMAGDPTNKWDRERAEHIKEKMKAEMEMAKLRGFAKTLIYEENNLATCVSTMIQSAGIGGLTPNTIMVGWPHRWKAEQDANDRSEYWDFMDKIHRGASLDMCLIVPKGIENFPSPQDRLTGSIDVWWILHDGGLLILLSFLLKQHKVWRGCKLRLFAVAQEKDNSIRMKEDLKQFIYQLRISASVEVVEFAGHEISAYAYERTLQMEERSKLISDLGLTPKEKKSLPQLLVERHRGASHSQETHELEAIYSDPESPKSETERQDSDESKKEESKSDLETGDNKEQQKENEIFKTPPTSKTERVRFLTVEPVKESDQDTDRPRIRDLLEPPSPSQSPGPSGPASPVDSERNSPEKELGDDVKTPDITPLTHSRYHFTFTPAVGNRKERLRALDKRKVKKMHTAVRLNQKIRQYSNESQLVILNLPRPPRTRIGLQNYMEYMEALTDQLPRCLLVRGSGKEVITIYS